MRIVSLLPAATEIVAALGGAESLVGISHECDYPRSVQHLPRVTATPVDSAAPGAVIDAEVRRLSASWRPVIGVEAARLHRLAPDLIITQSLCDVCAVPGGEVDRWAAGSEPAPRILALEGRTLSGIWTDIRRVAEVLDLADEAEELVLGLESRLRRLRTARRSRRPRVVCVEWLEPLYLAGHWVPELVEAAGGEDVGARPGSHSVRCEWSDLPGLRPDYALIMLCGFGVDRARTELENLGDPEALSFLNGVAVSIVDGNAYTSRPGPRVADGAASMHAVFSGRDAAPWQPVR